MEQNTPLFTELGTDDIAQEPTEIESCCMNCFKNGTTRLLLTKIPFYKEVVIMSFSCDFCGLANNELQSGGLIEPKGIRITLNVTTVNDLNRRIVKSDYTSVKFVDIDFEIPAQSQKGEVTTLEGIVERAITGLNQDQIVRRIDHPEAAQQIDTFIDTLKSLKTVDQPFQVIFEDISGNCYVENLNAPHVDNECTIVYFSRNQEQDHAVGIFTKDEINNDNEQIESKNDEKKSLLHPIAEDEWPLQELHGEVLEFLTLCPNCRASCETKMKVTSIPHFKDVIIMATCCDSCGLKTNEVKSGAGIEKKGVRIEVVVKCTQDLSRDVLKSESCSIHIPELDCEVGSYALGGKFTTIEGLLDSMKHQLSDGGAFRDSEDIETKNRIKKFVSELDKVIAGNRKITIILDDPAGNSYVQSLNEDGTTIDDRIQITKYFRTYDQNEELGLNDMKTENY